MDPEPRKQSAGQLVAAVDAFCDQLVDSLQQLIATSLEVGERDSHLAALIRNRLQEKDPLLADLFERMRIRFESVLMLHDHSIALLLRYLDRGRLSVALVGAPEDIKNQFFRNLSNAAVAQLKEAIEFHGPLAAEVVLRAREEIVDSVRKLERNGAIRFGEPCGEYLCG